MWEKKQKNSRSMPERGYFPLLKEAGKSTKGDLMVSGKTITVVRKETLFLMIRTFIANLNKSTV